ncbi:MAG: hypothetical protein M0R80_00605 [Proteobacteria bacterium]|jgi:hypothetical protein|nr:hypothetical protein [Pseudomonadota bacterium]
MKIRQGFVSNSSTSSFCIFGVGFISIADVAKALGLKPQMVNGCEHEFDRASALYCPECGEHTFVKEDEDDLANRAEEVCELHGLGFQNYTGECDTEEQVFVGNSPSGKGQVTIDRMIATNKACLELFGKEAILHSGEYAC